MNIVRTLLIASLACGALTFTARGDDGGARGGGRRRGGCGAAFRPPRRARGDDQPVRGATRPRPRAEGAVDCRKRQWSQSASALMAGQCAMLARRVLVARLLRLNRQRNGRQRNSSETTRPGYRR